MIALPCLNPNTIRSYKISQKLSPKHATPGAAQSPYPIYRHRKACLSKQPPWRAAGDPGLACGRSWVRTLAPAGTLHMLFSPSSLPSSFRRWFFRTFPTKPTKMLGITRNLISVFNLHACFKWCSKHCAVFTAFTKSEGLKKLSSGSTDCLYAECCIQLSHLVWLEVSVHQLLPAIYYWQFWKLVHCIDRERLQL